MALNDPVRPVRKSVAAGQLLIDGKWRDAASGETTTTTDPTTEATITTVAKCSPAEADAAVDAASRAFEDGPWSRMHHEERAKILFRMADLMDERADDFAIREAMDMGMPYRDFRETIMPHCSGLFRFHGALAMSALDGSYRTSYEHDVRILTRREPLGVIAAITPFNFPLALSASKVAPAVKINLQHGRRVIAGAARICRNNSAKPELAQVQGVHERLNHTHGVIPVDVVVDILRQKEALISVPAFHVACHENTRPPLIATKRFWQLRISLGTLFSAFLHSLDP
jgi:hypothetical protein